MQLRNATILIVDDEPMLLEIMALWFEREHCRVLTAENGAVALEKMALEPVHVVVSDVRMPVMDGMTLAKTIKAQGTYKPSVIFVSGFHDVSTKMCYDLGVEATLSKPIVREELIGIVKRLLTERSELWSALPKAENAPKLRVEFGAVSQAVEQGLISFGRGGFCIHCDLPVEEGPVKLAIDFASDRKTISGEGFVRWREPNKRQLGVEITSLDSICRDWVCQVSRANPTLSFIPADTRKKITDSPRD